MSDYHWYCDDNLMSQSQPGLEALGMVFRDQKKVAMNLRLMREREIPVGAIFVHEYLHILAPQLTEQEVEDWTYKIMSFITPEQEQHLSNMCLELIYGPQESAPSILRDPTLIGFVLGAEAVLLGILFVVVLQ